MDKTPIQQAIAERIEMIVVLQNKWLENANTGKEESYLILIEIVQSGIDNLKLLLPTERQFAETFYDAGWNYRENHDYDFNNEYPTFDNLYKKYTHD